MKDNFDKAFELVVGHEGGYTTDRKDRGNWTTGVIGKGQLKGTKYGVSAMAYPTLDIENLTLDQAKDIYFADYWSKVHASDLPAGLDYLLFDMAVNHGPKRAAELLQEAIGAVPDGDIGPRTMDRVRKRLAEDMITEVSARRVVLYGNLKTFKDYGLGWSRRLVSVLVTALDMSKRDDADIGPLFGKMT